MTATIEILEDCNAHWLPEQQLADKWVNAALQFSNQALPVNISVRFVEEEESQRLNRKFRNKDSATNVLSFPANLPESIAQQLDELPLGDIVVCPTIVEKEASDQGKELQSHWAHLLVHGTFHLLGYDHQTTEDAESMEILEISVLESLGIANPYLIG
ncbi:MAG: rRNA maturation RNase YbeY [Gammaproteobacteria bacterium]|jgi:probable rRNA maturation factor|nr:rRNA maturation RNase YbeY [Gammaproteobacteria bacterium]MBT3858932.1 rRNA maturation RNase YbeY [Gammaproteobacteria bacterium]MBT3988260.1 rRNA maturation RNase YbeY [Gammaproteobacteria bacterium]MBT4256878.1 rRNA maturation RNase YbeY [Gammaproteobacteria bacterium]MBT4582530.1 rRNA maturation RNase YbeY [Gammaproteobacteria bacterium]